MASEWPMRTIAECAANEPYSTQIGPFGDKIRAESYTKVGAPVLRGANVNTSERFHDDGFVFIDSDIAKKDFDKFVCEAGDVILCHKGTLGKIGIIPETNRFGKYIMGNSMMKVRCDRSKLDPLYLYYWLCSRNGQNYLFSRVSQVGVPQIQRPLTTLREAVLPVPPLEEQKAITRILGALDDKIELNRQMNATLEAMAQVLFQSWFVDFDPVHARAGGRQPTGMDEATAALFPASFENSKLGNVPVGWEVGSILRQAHLLSGGTPKTSIAEYWDGDILWASAKDVSQCADPLLITTERHITNRGLEGSSTKMIPAFATAVVARGATTGRLAMFGEEMAMNQTCYALSSKVGSQFSLYCQARDFIERMVHAAHGSVFDTITTKTFETTDVLLPPPDLLRTFDRVVTPLFDGIRNNLYQSRTLVSLRDTLLPGLLSGTIPVSTAEE
jgi:type I restriction enzyme S subunit